MGGRVIPGFRHWLFGYLSTQVLWQAGFAPVALVHALPAWCFFQKWISERFHAAPDMNSLVAVGTLAAWVTSTIVTFAPDLITAASRAVYFEAAAVIVTLILLGRARPWLRDR